VRFRFQGIRMNVRPFSFDAEAMLQLMTLPELTTWRTNGGVTISGPLGVPAVRKYYEPSLSSFNHRYIAREAFNAGNDILLLSEFALDDSWETHYLNVIDTIEFFREQYETDLSFQAQVDQAVRRVLTLKHRLYPEFELARVVPDTETARSIVGFGEPEVVRMAQQAATLLSPQSTDRLFDPPAPGEETAEPTAAPSVETAKPQAAPAPSEEKAEAKPPAEPEPVEEPSAPSETEPADAP